MGNVNWGSTYITGHPAWQPCNINEAKLPAGMTYFWPAKVAQDTEGVAQGINKPQIALVPNV